MTDLCPECGKPKCESCKCDEPKEKETVVSIQEKLGVSETAKILIE